MKAKGLFILILFLSVQIDAQRTDVVTMKNGDRLTCEITGVDHGTLYVKLDYVDGKIEIDWSKVAKLESNRLFIIKTDSGVVHEGTISTVDGGTGKIVQIEVKVDPKTQIDINTANVVTVETSDTKFLKRFNGYVNFGMNYAKGNDSRQYNLTALAEYPREHWNFRTDFSSNLNASEGDRSSTRNEARARIDRDIGKKGFFMSAGAGYLQSTEQGISRQTSFAGGIGYTFADSSRLRFAVIGGMVWQRTHYGRNDVIDLVQNQAAALVGTEFRYFRFKKAGIDFNADFLPSVSEPGRIFFKMNNTFYYKIFPRVTFNLSFYGGWDNRPPVGLPGSDYGTTTGLGWTFGNK